MLLFKKPSVETFQRFLDQQSPLGFSYDCIGVSRPEYSIGATQQAIPPKGFIVDHTRLHLGNGEPVYRAGVESLRRWSQFRLGWVECWPPDVPILEGNIVAILVRVLRLWWLNACRVVYVVEDAAPIQRFGFAYGTLPDHAESGEERFVIEWDQSDNSVWFDIVAYSHPNHVLTRLGYLWVRQLQKRFARDAVAALLAETNRIVDARAGSVAD